MVWCYKKCDGKNNRRVGRGSKQKTETFLEQKNWVLFAVEVGNILRNCTFNQLKWAV